MTKWKNILIGGTLTAGVVSLVSYLTRLKRTSAELESVATANIHSVKLDGLTVRIDVQLKNPTSTTLKIKYPFVKVINNKKVIGTSKVIDKDITIPKNGEAKIAGIMINIPATGLLSLGSGLLSLLTKKQAVPIVVQTITTIDLGWKKVPYSKSDDMTLKPKTA